MAILYSVGIDVRLKYAIFLPYTKSTFVLRSQNVHVSVSETKE